MLLSLSQLERLVPRTPTRRLISSLSEPSRSPASTCAQLNTHHHHPPSESHQFVWLLQRCSKNLRWVYSLHAQVIATCLSGDQFLASKLVKVYSHLGNLVFARKVFNQFCSPRVYLSNAMVSGYLRHEMYGDVVRMYELIRSTSEPEIDSCTVSCALKACTMLSAFETGFEVMRDAVELGMEKDVFFGSSAINFLVEFGDVDEAKRVFDAIPQKDVVCWNSMIGGYMQLSRFGMAFRLFFDMFVGRVKPNSITMMTLTQACGGMGSLKLGACVHALIIGQGLDGDVLVLTSLVDMYHELGESDFAGRVFDRMPIRNLVSWNAMISGCIQNGLIYESFDLSRSMVVSGQDFDATTLVSLLQGCSQIASIERGKVLHGYVIRRGLDSNYILSTALIDFYAKCGSLEQATFLFEKMKEKNVVTWTALLVGFAQNGHAKDALKLFKEMQEHGIAANAITLVSLLHSCAHLGYLKKGRSIHAHLLRSGFSFDAVCITALIDMYFKCGKLNYALNVFTRNFCLDVGLWNSMITGYGTHGHGSHAIDLYRRMIKVGVRPNQTTFLCLLSACSHAGLVDHGLTLFNSMKDYDISPTEKHYACVVDLLSRAGRLHEAEALIRKMPFEPSSAVLEALLSGCRTHKNMEMGVHTADKLIQLNSMNPGIYVLLSNIYAAAKRWDAVHYVRGLMRNRGLKKAPGFSSIEVRNEIHTFLAGDDSHPSWEEIDQLLENLRLKVEALGYIPDTSCVLRNVDEQMKVQLLWRHSERLAIAFGLLSTPAGCLIRITKNLRVCADCHVVTKYIAKIAQREIIVRDANRFHHFFNGQCSCGDYW